MVKKEELEKELFVGIDIGSSKICVVIASEYQNQLSIIGIGESISEGISRGVIMNFEKVLNSLKVAISKAEEMSGVKIHSASVGITGEHIQSLLSRGVIAINNTQNQITKNDVNRLIRDTRKVALPNDREIIHVFPQHYVIDGQSGFTDPIGMNGIRLEATVYIVTGVSSVLQNIRRCVESCGIRVQEIVIQSLASSYSTLIEEEQELGVCVVDIGSGTTDVIIFEDKVIRHIASIPYAGYHITQDIKKGIGILNEQAEEIKCKYGSAFLPNVLSDEIITIPGIAGRSPVEISKTNLSRIIQARMEEIFELVFEEIRRSGYYRQLSAGIVFTGGTAMLNGTKDIAHSILDMPIKIGIPTGFSLGLVKEIEYPKYATCCGLVISAFHRQKKKLSEVEQIEERPFFSKILNWFKQI